jgi:dipeptidyl aminopeptidase/acylaminoacyl peptidase
MTAPRSITFGSTLVSLALAFGSMACGSHDTEQRALAATPNGAQSTRTADAPLTWEAYLSLPSVSAFAWAPSGTHIAYVASEEGKSSIYVVDAVSGAPRRLVDGASPQWSPDGSRIAYLAQGDVWTVPAAGGTPMQVTKGPEDERDIRLSPDGTQIAFMSTRSGSQDVWVVPAAGGAPKQLTTKSMDADEVRFGPEWSRDGKDIVFVSNRAAWDRDDLWLVSASGGEPRRLTTQIRTRFTPVWSPTGKQLALQAFRHEEFSYGDMTDLYVVDAAAPRERKLDLPTYISGQPAWSPDGKEIVVGVVNRGDTNLWRVAVDDAKHATQMTYLDGNINQYAYSPDGKWIAYLHNSPVRPSALMVMPAAGGQTRTLVDVAPPLRDVKAPRRVAFRSFDGKFIEGFLYLPPGSDRPGAKFPGLVEVHGGGTNLYRNGFNAIEQLFAQKGFVVLSVNYRGSSGYGREFQDLSTLDWCNGQAHDAAEGAMYLRRLDISSGKVGIYGYSYGGITSMAAAARFPYAFDAAVPMAGIYDFAVAYPPADRVGKLFYELGHGGSPSKNPAAYEHSRTLSHIANVKAPILELHGEADVRAPFGQQAALAAELKKHNKVFETHSYPGEPHGFRKLADRADLYVRCEAWMNKYLRPTS